MLDVMYRHAWVLTCALLVGGACAGAKYGGSFKHSRGAALAPPGVSGGNTNSVRVADVGGPLARAGLYGLALVTAAGAYRETSRSTTTYRSGNYIVTETRSSGYIDKDTAEAAGKLAEAATSSEPVGLQGSLDIASRNLGGDTSGWMYQLGYKGEPFACGPIACRIFGGVGVGWYTFHDRLAADGSGRMIAESEYNYFGIPLRLELHVLPGVAGFVQADLNLVTAFNAIGGDPGSPSPWHAGVELKLGVLVGRITQTWGRAKWDASSTTFEVGLGF